MKQTRLFALASLIAVSLLAVFIYSCNKKTDIMREPYYVTSTSLDIKAAKEYYKLLKAETGTEARSVNPGKHDHPNNKYLMFGKAVEGRSDAFSVVEVPLYYNRKVTTVIARLDTGMLTKEQEVRITNASLTRVIFYRDEHTGKVSQYIANYIPDLAYLDKVGNDISHNSIFHIDTAFSGYIKYSTWDGKSLKLFKIRHGKGVKRYKYSTAISAEEVARRAARFKQQQATASTTSSTVARNTYQVCDNELVSTVVINDCELVDPESYDVVCTSYTVDVYEQVCYEYDDGNDDANDDYGDDEGDDGFYYPCDDPTNFNLPECGGDTQETPPQPDDGCATAQAQYVTNIANTPGYSSGLALLNNAMVGNNDEHSVAFNKDANGNIMAPTTVSTGGETSTSTPINNNTVATLHNHNDGRPPSVGDIYGLIEGNKDHPNFVAKYVKVGNTMYALVMTDAAAAASFVANYPEYVPSGGGSPGFPDDLNNKWSDMFFGNGAPTNEETATAYILDKYNIGVALVKQNANGSFSKLGAVKTGSDESPIYTETNCNN
ncbi:MAG: hypothetical protein QM610_00970 [Chitinophagaceae bacterium]